MSSTRYWLEDVSINIRSLTGGYKPYRWQYQKTNRLDENIRKAVILRDNCMCMECGKTNCRLEVHHIQPRRLNGSNTLSNLITLCTKCHQKTEGVEERYMSKYFSLLKSSENGNLRYAQHVMIGKKWLRGQLSNLGVLHLTNGGDTANKRVDWDIEKSHSNDAICITDSRPDTCKNGETHRGYVTALYPKQNALSFKSPTKYCAKVNAKKCKVLWRYNKIYWLDNVN